MLLIGRLSPHRVGPPGASQSGGPVPATSNCPASTGAMVDTNQARLRLASSDAAMHGTPHSRSHIKVRILHSHDTAQPQGHREVRSGGYWFRIERDGDRGADHPRVCESWSALKFHPKHRSPATQAIWVVHQVRPGDMKVLSVAFAARRATQFGLSETPRRVQWFRQKY